MFKRVLAGFMMLSFSSLAIADAVSLKHCENSTIFNIGAGIYDITGPAAEIGMMGYGMLQQQTGGIYQRLWARAFVLESPCNAGRVVFVNTDLGMVFQGVKQQVIARLKEKYGDRFTDDNVLLTATHTHSGPGGFSTHLFYNITTLGFNRRNFDTIVDGIVAAIERANKNLAPAQIKMASGQLNGINFSRSPQSYLLNPPSERQRYAYDVDKQMTLIRFDRLDGTPIGMINWFPIHGVSMNNKNHLITGDNKGYAEYLFEKDFHSDRGPNAFVAAFAQANAGDVSPNEYGHEGGLGLAGLEAIEKAALPQYKTAKALYQSANTLVKGGIAVKHQFVAMDEVTVLPPYTDGNREQTCPAAIGVSMLAGTQDGEGVGWQGVKCDELSNIFKEFACEAATTSCQGVKPIVLSTGTKKPYPWTPNILPFQEMKIGSLVIVAAPFELTTMTGRRIRESVQAVLPSNHHVVISALSNAYSGYVATKEEYQLQRYEGASTHFGPWTAAALRQIFVELANALVTDAPVAEGPIPPDLSTSPLDMQPGVWFDDKPLNQAFGSLAQDALPLYHAGDTIEVVFWGGHPKNNLHTQDTFLRVQRLENGVWKTIRDDNDWDTEYHWMRNGIANSLITIVWRTSNTVTPGYYRIQHTGEWKSGWSGKITTYTGYSSTFEIK